MSGSGLAVPHLPRLRRGPFLSRLAGEDERGQKRVSMTFEIRTLTPGDHALFEGMLDVFAAAFEDAESYARKRPGPDYVARLLNAGNFGLSNLLSGNSARD